jgi:hypothetical protein
VSDSPKKSKFWPPDRNSLIIVSIVLAYLIYYFLGGGSSSLNSISSMNGSTNQTSTDTSWIPGGYSAWEDGSNLAYAVGPDISQAQCGYEFCFGIYVVSKSGCKNSLYGEIDLVDKTGTKIGYSNATLGSLSPGTKGLLIFHVSGGDLQQMDTWPVSKISCY